MRVRRFGRSVRTPLLMTGGYLMVVLSTLTLMEMAFLPVHTDTRVRGRAPAHGGSASTSMTLILWHFVEAPAGL